MNIMKMFNMHLKTTLLEEKKRLLDYLANIPVDGMNKKQIEIAYQIVNREIFEVEAYSGPTSKYSYISFKPQKHFFSFKECSIEGSNPGSSGTICPLSFR